MLSGEESHSDNIYDILNAFENVVTEIKEQIRCGDKNFNKGITKFVSKYKQLNVGQNFTTKRTHLVESTLIQCQYYVDTSERKYR